MTDQQWSFSPYRVTVDHQNTGGFSLEVHILDVPKDYLSEDQPSNVHPDENLISIHLSPEGHVDKSFRGKNGRLPGYIDHSNEILTHVVGSLETATQKYPTESHGNTDDLHFVVGVEKRTDPQYQRPITITKKSLREYQLLRDVFPPAGIIERISLDTETYKENGIRDFSPRRRL